MVPKHFDYKMFEAGAMANSPRPIAGTLGQRLGEQPFEARRDVLPSVAHPADSFEQVPGEIIL